MVRNIFLFEHASPDRMVNIMVDEHLIRQADDLSFQRMRRTRRDFMIQDSVSCAFPGQVRSLALLFRRSTTIRSARYAGTQRAYLVKRPFSRMAEGVCPRSCPSAIASTRSSLDEEPWLWSWRSGIPPAYKVSLVLVMIPFGKKEYLRLQLPAGEMPYGGGSGPGPSGRQDGYRVFLFRAVSSS